MLRSRRGSLTLALGIAIVLSLGVSVAFAAPLVMPPGVTSVSNLPAAWRGGWGSSLWPDYGIGMSGATGAYYVTDRSPSSVIDTSTLLLYSHSPVSGGTIFSNVVDIIGTYNYPPPGGWVYSMPGMATPVEGVWYLHVAPYTGSPSGMVFGPQIDVPIGIDQTPPGAVTGVLVSPNPAVPFSTTAVTAGTRATVKWDGGNYDGLSGTAYYTIYVDGDAAISGAAGAVQSIAESIPPIWYQPTWLAPYTVTIEDLAPGRHEIKMTATDLAANEGATSAAAVIYADPDVPQVTVTTPDVCGRYVSLTCSAIDAGGVQFVDWYVDGRYLGRVGAPFSLYADMAGFGVGGHTVTAVAVDMAGRTATGSRWITVLNLSVPYATRISDSPDPFFPIRRDRYRDDMLLKFRLSERCAVWVEIYDESNTLVRTMWCGWRRAGSNSLKWNGQLDDGTIREGGYHYRIVTDDGQGNRFYSGWGWTRIRSYILKRLSRNRVKVIYH